MTNTLIKIEHWAVFTDFIHISKAISVSFGFVQWLVKFMLNRLFFHKFHYYMAFKIKNMLWDLYVPFLQTTYRIYERFDWFHHNSFEFLYHGSLQLLYHWQCLGRIETFYQQQINAWSRKQKDTKSDQDRVGDHQSIVIDIDWSRLLVSGHWSMTIIVQWSLVWSL